MNVTKRQRKQSAPNGMHISLPPPDLSSFKEPALPAGMSHNQQPTQTGSSNTTQPSTASQQPPIILGKELQHMEDALKNMTVRVAEIYRYHADKRKMIPAGTKPPPIPASMSTALGRETERFDQLCDMVEVQLMRALKVLNRDAKRERAKQEAIMMAEREKVLKEQREVLEKAGVAMQVSSNGVDNDVSMNVESGTQQPSDGIITVSVSALQPPAELSGTPSTQPLADPSIQRNPKRFPLKLDLSSTALHLPLQMPGDPVTRISSPVTLAPKTARPRNDDPLSALVLGGFGSGVGSFSATGQSFTTGQMPLTGVSTVPGLNGGSDLLPDFLALVAQQGGPSNANSQSQNMFPVGDTSTSNFLNSLPVSMPSSQSINISLQNSRPSNSVDADIIDLTQGTPISERTMQLPLNIGDDGTIDLTMDSPPIPLRTIIDAKNAAQQGKQSVGLPGNEDGGLGLKGTNGPGDGSGSTNADITSSGAEPESNSIATDFSTTNATNLLASLTAAAAAAANTTSTSNENVDKQDDNTNRSSANTISTTNPLGISGLSSLSELPLSDLGMSMPVNLGDMGMDLGGLNMDMFMNDAGAGGLDFGSTNVGSNPGGNEGLDLGNQGGTGLNFGTSLTDGDIGLADFDMMEGFELLSGIGEASTSENPLSDPSSVSKGS